MTTQMFMQFDTVRYTGQKLTSQGLTRDKVGEVISFVEGQRNALVVDFGGDTFIIDAKNLVKHSYRDNVAGPEVDRIVRKWNTPDEDKKKGKGK